MNNISFEENIKKVSSDLDNIINNLIDTKYNNSSLNNKKIKLKEKILKKLFELKIIIEDNNSNNNDLIKKNSNNLERVKVHGDNFKIVKVNGDGSCLYHSIMKSINIMNINIIDKINRLKLKNIQVNDYTELNGIFLRNLLVKYLENIPNKYITDNQNQLQRLTSKSQIERMKINSAIQSEDLILDPKYYTDSKYYNKNTKQIIIPLKDRINKLKKNISNRNKWGSEEQLQLISFVLDICIYCFDKKRNDWILYKNSIQNCNSENNIFIIYNGINHYDSLKPI